MKVPANYPFDIVVHKAINKKVLFIVQHAMAS
jgi:hypothetical protein